MGRLKSRWLFALLTFVGCLASWGTLRAEDSKGDSPITYEKDVRPLLRAHCFHCHGEGMEIKAGLDLRLRRFLVAGGDSGPALVPGKPDESLLIERVTSGEMPPGDKNLSDSEQAIIAKWIAAGAVTARPEPETIDDSYIAQEEREFWSFQPITRSAVPHVQHANDVRNPIDAFLLEKLETQGLSFSPAADRLTLLRRAYYDLTGLPPTPEEADAFLANDSPDAYERLIDQLLASPRYGERWGRHWLDVAGYADSEGYTEDDAIRKYAYKYRDYVIRAFNEDKPFDQFLVEQLAGDELVTSSPGNWAADDVDRLVATGFLRMAPDGTGAGGVDQTVARNQVMADSIKIVSTSLLGLSVGCAECHNHRYDPIPQVDYYRFRAIFEPAYDWKNWRAPRNRLISLYTPADREQAAAIEAEAVKLDEARIAKQNEYIEQTVAKELEKLPEEIRETVRAAREAPANKRTPEQAQLLKDHPSVNVSPGSLYLYDRAAADDLKKQAENATALRATKPVEDFVRPLMEIPGKVPETFVFFRGDASQPREKVEPAELTVVRTDTGLLPLNDLERPSTGRRLAFARNLTSGTHPLTARVLVNRFWLHHFGRGIVGTPGDFGVLGERPTHPELLDWLASEFMEQGWTLKRMHKLIMLSSAYRQSSQRTSQLDQIDPDNLLYGRANVRRNDAETLRDAILVAAGHINHVMFGPPVPVMEDEVGQVVVGIENLNGENRPGAIIPLNGEEYRRSVYVQARRSRPLAVLDTFDAPVMEPNCEARNASTVAPQALMLMNSTFILEEAKAFAERVEREAGADPAAQVRLAWRITLTRTPTEEELKGSIGFLEAQQAEFRKANEAASAEKTEQKPAEPSRAALTSLCQALLSSNGFLYVD